MYIFKNTPDSEWHEIETLSLLIIIFLIQHHFPR